MAGQKRKGSSHALRLWEATHPVARKRYERNYIDGVMSIVL